MADRVVGVAFERDVWVFPLHPEIERVAKKQVRQYGTDHSPLRGSSVSVNQAPVRQAPRRAQPPLKVEQHPWPVRVPPHGSHQEFPIDLVEEALDIKVDDPVIRPAPLLSFDEGIMR